ncbi:hypothetical protein TNCV_2553451 [Trichonephila clavipes]|nr:hypothetical protein TNCV_2553451 [Trichonephila clavipes]
MGISNYNTLATPSCDLSPPQSTLLLEHYLLKGIFPMWKRSSLVYPAAARREGWGVARLGPSPQPLGTYSHQPSGCNQRYKTNTLDP